MLDYEVLNVIIGDLIIKTVVECKQSIIRISIIYFYSGCFVHGYMEGHLGLNVLPWSQLGLKISFD